MRIARLIDNFSENFKGGLMPNAFYLSKYQEEQGHDVRIFTFTENEDYRDEVDGIEIYFIKKPHVVRTFGGKQLINQIKSEFKPDIVHSISCLPFGWLFPYYKNELNCKYALSIHGTVVPLQKSVNKGVRSKADSLEYGKLMRFLAKRVDLVLPVADFIKKELVSFGVKETKIKVIPTGMDFQLFNTPKKIGKNDKFTVLYVGRFAQQKGLQYLIKSIDILKNNNIRLVMIGGTKQDNDYENVLELIKELKLEKIVKILNSVPYKDLPSIYQSADVFVLPSTLEPRAKAINEAQAAGTPVIATDQGGVRETIKNEHNGLIVPIKNPQAIADAVLKIKLDNELREKLITNGIETAKKNDWKIISDIYTQTFINILNNKITKI